MAHVFKHPSRENKGIVVFTHKELKFFSEPFRPTRYEGINKLQKLLFNPNKLKPSFKKSINEIRKKYFLGIHYGWSHTNLSVRKEVDFIMGNDSTVGFKKGIKNDIFRIPMNSRCFIPKAFQPDNQISKYWDIICVSRNAKFKNLDLFLQAAKNIYNQKKKYKILLIIPGIKSKNNKKIYTSILDDYYKLFTEEEQQLFTIVKLAPEYSFSGLNYNVLSHFYRSSKVFTLFSEKEGESRVISEALLCQLPVIVKSDLIGGGRDFLNKTNSIQFDTFNQAHNALIQAVENYESFNFETPLEKELRSDYSIEKLKKYFQQLYAKQNMEFDGELININDLHNRLPGHYNELPWKRSRFQTADILSKNQFNLFIKELHL